MVVDFAGLRRYLESKLEKPLIQTGVLLGNCRLIDEESRSTAAYTDPRYLPFYYHLGTQVTPGSVAVFGFRLGLSAACFFRGCKSAERFFGFQEQLPDAFYSPRLAVGNVKDHFKGEVDCHFGGVTDDALAEKFTGEWDLCIVDEETSYDCHRVYLDVLWGKLSHGGLLVADYLTRHEPARRAFQDFTRYTNREPAFFKTRYGVGVIQK